MIRTQMRACVVLACLLPWMGSCTSESKLAGNNELSGGLWSLQPRSPEFDEKRSMPKKYAVDEMNISPPITWKSGPNTTKEYVLIMESTRSRGRQPLVHWIVYGIPASAQGLAEGAAGDSRLIQGTNHTGTIGYAGPHPNRGPEHYYFQLFALAAPLNLPPGADRKKIIEAMDGLVLVQGRLETTYPEK